MLRIFKLRKCLWCLAVMAVCSGCALGEPDFWFLLKEPFAYSSRLDRRHTYRKHRNRAIEVWQTQCAASAPEVFCNDYRIGFIDGYADYLNLGGCGEPPLVPPQRYWKYMHRSPQGHQAVIAYFDGFRHGARLALAHGDYYVLTSPWPCEIGSQLVGCTHLTPGPQQTWTPPAGGYHLESSPQEFVAPPENASTEVFDIMPDVSSWVSQPNPFRAPAHFDSPQPPPAQE